MTAFETSRRVGHRPENMFDLIADVEKYPEFVPLCKSLVIRSRAPQADGTEQILADMTVAYKLIQETFTSRVTLDKKNLRILVEYVDGPFRYLETRWAFASVGGGTDVSFNVVYEFKNRMLSRLMGAIFDATFRKFADAFERRADEVYGRPAPQAALGR